MKKTLTTYSMLSTFRNCPKKCQFRYIDYIVPHSGEQSAAQRLGSVVHECLEHWYKSQDPPEVRQERIEAIIAKSLCADEHRYDAQLASAMMRGYIERYPISTEYFTPIHLEEQFRVPLINPATQWASTVLELGGKIDGLVRDNMSMKYYLLEHKTAARIDGSYLDRLWADFQVHLYAWCAATYWGIEIEGIIYNVLAKTKIRPRQTETEEEFNERLIEKYKDPEMFHREILYLSSNTLEMLLHETWLTSQAFLTARRTKLFYRNTSYCFSYNTPCAYFPLCRSNESPIVRRNLYTTFPFHRELGEPINPEEYDNASY